MTSKRCKNCGKIMQGAHPNKKFCSNRGRNNCKDAHHNATFPRNGRRYQHPHEYYDDDIEYGHPFAAGMDGHGQN